MATWPPSLPQYVLVEGYSESPPENTIRSANDVGPPKARQRSTTAPRPFTLKQFLTKTQVATLDTFYVTTLGYGASIFDWVHPRTGDAADFRFVSSPSYESLGGTAWMVTLNLELMP
jgi:hypothetical protein